MEFKDLKKSGEDSSEPLYDIPSQHQSYLTQPNSDELSTDEMLLEKKS